MKELFLLGAGASVEAEIPDSYKMANQMLSRFTENDFFRYDQYSKVLKFVIGGLLFQQGVKGKNPFDGVNIEELFNTIIMLGDRENSELIPFISSWHPKLVGLESGSLGFARSQELLRISNEPIEKYVNEQIENAIRRLDGRGNSLVGLWGIDRARSFSNYGWAFSNAVREVVSGSGGFLFRETADAMMQNLIKMVWIKDVKKVNYLLPLLDYGSKTHSSFITLNYDNSIELIGHDSGINVDTGFDTWSDSGEFNFSTGNIPLIKLHGSIDWALSDGQINDEKPLKYQIINKVNLDLKDNPIYQPAVIFGGKNKLTAKGPFLSLLRAFEKELMTSDLLTIIGYSFRDEHVNEFITNWFNGDIARRIRIININVDSLNQEYVYPLVKGQAKERVEVIEENASVGIRRIAKNNNKRWKIKQYFK